MRPDDNKPQINIQRGMRWKMMVAMVGMIVTLVVLLTVLQVSAHKESLNNAQAVNTFFLEEQMHRQAKKASAQMSGHIEKLISTFRLPLANTFIRNVVRDIEDLRYVILMQGDEPKVAIGSDLDAELREYILSGKISGFAAIQKKEMHHDFNIAKHGFMETIVPIMLHDEQWGVLRLGFSRDEVDRSLAASQARIDAEIRNALVRATVTSFIFLILGALGVYYFARRWTDPIQNLVQFSRELASGDFSATAHISTRGDDEIGLLVSSLEDMADALKQSYAQLEEHSHTLEEKVEKRTRELAEARDKALAATRSKSDFLANMSHEIRTPMNAVIGMTHLALDAATEDTQRQHLEKALSASQSLLTIINEILDFSKIEAGKMILESVDFHLPEILNHVDSIAGIQARQKGLDVVFKSPQSLPVLHGDGLRLGQILLNLVSNAVKFTKAGRVRLTISVIEQSNTAIHLQFSISDSGIGMSEDQLSHLFEAFTQADASTTRNYGGTGLGLAICKQLVDLMDGDITAESNLGQGSCFHVNIRFGLGNTATQSASTTDEKINLHGIPSLQGNHLLLVEDHDINQQVAEGLLAKTGVQLTIVGNGKLAVEAIKHHIFDGILMDMQMPVMGGLEATRIIRADGRFDALPIIAMTANAMPSDRHSCLEAGMNDHIPKPIDPNTLYATLARWLTPATDTHAHLPPNADEQQESIDFSPIRGIDIADGLQRVAGDQHLYRKILCKFRNTQADSLQGIKTAQQAGDKQQALHLLHALSGVAGNIGASMLATHAQSLESALKANQEVDQSTWQQAERQLAEIIDSTSEFCVYKQVNQGNVENASDHTAINQLIIRMQQLLEDSDGDAVDLIDELSTALANTDAATHMVSLQQHLACYDFDAAKQDLKAIAEHDHA